MKSISTLFENINYLTVRNTDDGFCFTDTTRLDKIEELLKESPFYYVKKEALFYAFSQIPFTELGDDTLIVSSHVDFKRETKECFSDTTGEKKIIGTYDNSATNTAVVELMLHAELPKNTLVVFTGDEEEDSGGAAGVAGFIKHLGIRAKCIVLDVTEEGYKSKAAFSIENAYCDDTMLETIIRWMVKQNENYLFVPAEEEQKQNKLIKHMLPKKCVSKELAEPDESGDYSEHHIDSFSFCLPTKLMDPKGKFAPNSDSDEAMHSSKGLKIRKESIVGYTNALCDIIKNMAK